MYEPSWDYQSGSYQIICFLIIMNLLCYYHVQSYAEYHYSLLSSQATKPQIIAINAPIAIIDISIGSHNLFI